MSRVLVEASPIETKYLIKQSTNRAQFDAMCRKITVVQTIDDNSVIVNFVDTKYHMNRDFCILRHDYTTVRNPPKLMNPSTKRCFD